MGNILYFECASGISGDMTAAALLDLGADRERLEKVLSTIPADGFSIKISRVKKSGIDCMDFDVIVDEEHETHDHDMEWLYGHEKGSGEDHDEDHGHKHHHKHDKKHDKKSEEQEQRELYLLEASYTEAAPFRPSFYIGRTRQKRAEQLEYQTA